MAIRLARRRLGLWSTYAVCALVVAGVVAAGFATALRWSRDSLTVQVQEAERLLADERAGRAATALDQARDRLQALSHQAVFAATFRDADRWRLENVLHGAASLPAIARYTAYDPAGRVLVEADGIAAGDHGRVTYANDVVTADGATVGRLEVQISVPALVPAWELPASTGGSVLLLDRRGDVVVGGDAEVPAELRDAVRRGRTAVLTYDAPGGRRIGAITAVGRAGLVVVASEPQRQANEAAHRLTVRVLGLLAACLALLSVVAAVVVRQARRSRRTIESERATAEALAASDPLTGVANRRGLDAALAATAGTVTVAAVDVDGLKEVNDRLGHGAGDAALQDVAAALRSAARPGDVVARIGGDEFVVVWFDSDDDLEPKLDARLREAVGELTRTGASVGVATGGHADFLDLLTTADQRCYEDKRIRRGEHVFDYGPDACSAASTTSGRRSTT